MNLNPHELGWHEFSLRIAVIFFVGSFLLLALAVAGKVIASLVDLVRWLIDWVNGEEEETMTESSLHRAVLRLVPGRNRAKAEELLRRLLGPRREGDEVYVAEYDGKAASVHLSASRALGACAGHLADEPGPDVPWDWFEDDYGWVMRRVNMDTMAPVSLLSGRVTRTWVQA